MGPKSRLATGAGAAAGAGDRAEAAVASSKAVQTDFGIFPLKHFFSEGISTDSGEEVSSREVKQIIKDIIESEDKNKPFSDDKLEKILNEKGYNIARRTVAKYREQLNIPVARLRKELPDGAEVQVAGQPATVTLITAHA